MYWINWNLIIDKVQEGLKSPDGLYIFYAVLQTMEVVSSVVKSTLRCAQSSKNQGLSVLFGWSKAHLMKRALGMLSGAFWKCTKQFSVHFFVFFPIDEPLIRHVLLIDHTNTILKVLNESYISFWS